MRKRGTDRTRTNMYTEGTLKEKQKTWQGKNTIYSIGRMKRDHIVTISNQKGPCFS